MTARAVLESAFRAGVEACSPANLVPRHLPPAPDGRVIVLAAGKAAATMAAAVEAAWDRPLEGLVVTRQGYARPLRQLELIEAGHPVPDQGSADAAERLLALAESAQEGDFVLFLLSGGASAMLTAAPASLGLEGKIAVTRALLHSGAPIEEMNLVRRHLSRIKGGRLAAAAWPATLLTLGISDVTGDRLEDIGSGPSAPDPTTLAQACAILDRCGIAVPRESLSESIKPGDPSLARATYQLIGGGAVALAAAGDHLRDAGYEPIVIAIEATGEAREVAADHARIALEYLGQGRRVALLSGGELTVTVRGAGRGGPNQEYALALAQALDGAAGVYALAADTDGVDGTHDVAGAFALPDTLALLAGAGRDPRRALDDNDAGGAFAAIDGLLITGPTETNVNDLRMILIEG